ncbi:MAG: PHP-associated domain-containing protein [Nanoarchaeota archaeon]|nr:PHP-associated domain-containing protein [Nanoarchaeota archaeon]
MTLITLDPHIHGEPKKGGSEKFSTEYLMKPGRDLGMLTDIYKKVASFFSGRYENAMRSLIRESSSISPDEAMQRLKKIFPSDNGKQRIKPLEALVNNVGRFEGEFLKILADRIEGEKQKQVEIAEGKTGFGYNLNHDVPELLRSADKSGIDFIALTNHDKYSIEAAKNPRVLPGVELSVHFPGVQNVEFHVGVLGANPEQFQAHYAKLMQLRNNVFEVFKYAEQNKLAAALNHPALTHWYQDSGLSLAQLKQVVDAAPILEVRNGNCIERQNKLVEDYAVKNKKNMIAGSDSHNGSVARAFTNVYTGQDLHFDKPEEAKQLIIEALINGDTKPSGDHASLLNIWGTVADHCFNYDKMFFERPGEFDTFGYNNPVEAIINYAVAFAVTGLIGPAKMFSTYKKDTGFAKLNE